MRSSSSSEKEEALHSDIAVTKSIRKRKCFCSFYGRNRIIWELFIMFTAAVNCFIVPFSIAFHKSYYHNLSLLLLLNYIIDFIFLVDIAVN